MSSSASGERVGLYAGRSLADDLASLRIERRGGPKRPGRGGGGGGLVIRLLSALLWLVPMGLLGGAGFVGYRQYEKIRPKATVSVALVQSMTTGEAETLLSAKGYLKSRNQVAIGAKIPGRVEQVLVEEGMRVTKGQLLAVLEHNDILAQLESRKAMVERSEAELLESESDLEMKDRKAKRAQSLLGRGVGNVEETDLAVSSRRMAVAKVAALQAAIHLQKAMVRECEETIKNLHIVAPFAGTVTSKDADVGETLALGGMGGASGRGSVVTLANLDALEVETDVAENLLSRVTVGQPAEISVSAVPGKHYRGRLRRVVPMGDRTRGTVKVKVEVLDPDERLFPELVATVHFLPDKALKSPDAGKSFLFVPKAAIVEQSGHSFVWVVDRKPTVHRRRVDVVVSNDDLARVESGVSAGDSVVINPAKDLKDGEPVKVAE
jgi:RND family efflux transporter MFP subunit